MRTGDEYQSLRYDSNLEVGDGMKLGVVDLDRASQEGDTKFVLKEMISTIMKS